MIQPALTPEEWATNTLTAESNGTVRLMVGTQEVVVYGPRCHSLAALCLYNQPFGFTKEDVETLTDALDFDPAYPQTETERRVLVAISKIVALLPPVL